MCGIGNAIGFKSGEMCGLVASGKVSRSKLKPKNETIVLMELKDGRRIKQNYSHNTGILQTLLTTSDGIERIPVRDSMVAEDFQSQLQENIDFGVVESLFVDGVIIIIDGEIKI